MKIKSNKITYTIDPLNEKINNAISSITSEEELENLKKLKSAIKSCVNGKFEPSHKTMMEFLNFENIVFSKVLDLTRENHRLMERQFKKKLRRRFIPDDKLKIYKMVIKELAKDKSSQRKSNRSDICRTIEKNEKLEYNLYYDFNRWRDNNPSDFEKYKKEIDLELWWFQE